MWRQVSHVPDACLETAALYSGMEMSGIKVTAILGKNYAPAIDGAIHLDGLLAYAAMKDCAELPPFDKSKPSIFPVPLKVLWVSTDGIPLVAATNMLPEQVERSTEYWHKRFPVKHVQRLCEKPNTPTSRGGFKEYRIPMRVNTAESITGYCIGNKKEVERLLNKYVINVGKKPSQGKGFVIAWKVEEHDVNDDFILSNRSVPAEFSGKQARSVGGWCAPYWFRPWHKEI
jgi:hypothetical protein